MSPDRELLEGNTPVLILAVLADGPAHGYGIAREIERRSRGALSPGEGSLYPALHALERDGLVAGGGGRSRPGRPGRCTASPRPERPSWPAGRGPGGPWWRPSMGCSAGARPHSRRKGGGS